MSCKFIIVFIIFIIYSSFERVLKNGRMKLNIFRKSSLKFTLQTYFTPRCSVSIINFEQVNAGWMLYQSFIPIVLKTDIFTTF